MCRSRSDGGRRCPCRENEHARTAANIRQLLSRYSRAADAASQRGDTAEEDRYVALFEKQLNRMVEHDTATRPLPDKPPSRADAFSPDRTREMTDQELADAFHDNLDDPATMDAIMACLDERDRERDQRREQQRAAEAAQRAWTRAAEVASPPPADPLHNPARRPARRLTKQEQAREEYEVALHAKYLAAEEATNGHMLNARGLALGIDPYTLFSGPARRATAYGSDELLSWFRENGRLTFKSFRHALLGWASDSGAARNARLEDYGHVA